jgi:hypothetical protein
MAKVIRNKYVFRKGNVWHQYLPRRVDGNQEYNFAKNKAMPEDFNQPMEVDQPPKLWLVWAYRRTDTERKWTKENLKSLFGSLPTPGKMHVFKNTASINDKLWKVKPFIEVRPITFPNGEPTEADAPFTELFVDGRCIVDREAATRPTDIPICDTKTQFKKGYLEASLKRRYETFKDVYPDTVYTPGNITLVE